jgi:hypothetical protein
MVIDQQLLLRRLYPVLAQARSARGRDARVLLTDIRPVLNVPDAELEAFLTRLLRDGVYLAVDKPFSGYVRLGPHWR